MNWDDDFVCHTTINSCATFENVQTQKRRKKLSIAKLSFQKRFFLASSRKKSWIEGKTSLRQLLRISHTTIENFQALCTLESFVIFQWADFFSSWRHTMKKEYFAPSHCRNGSHKTYKIENFKTSLFFVEHLSKRKYGFGQKTEGKTEANYNPLPMLPQVFFPIISEVPRIAQDRNSSVCTLWLLTLWISRLTKYKFDRIVD